MAESIGTARLDIVVDTSSLDAGVTKARRSTSDMAKAAQDASQKMDAGTKRQVASLERQIATLGKSRSEVIRWRIEQLNSGNAASALTAKLDAQVLHLKNVNGIFDRAGASAKRLAAQWTAVGVAAATAAIGFGIRNATEFADHLNDINQRLGISAEALSSWAYAAQQSGTDIDALGVGLKKLAKNMGEALDPKSSQAKLFQSLGIQIRDASGNLRRLEDVLPQIATRFKELDNATTEAALAQEFFGKSGTDLVEFLNLGASGLANMQAKARALGVELSQGTLQAADEFNDSLADLRTASRGLFTQLAADLLPSLKQLVTKLTELVNDGRTAANVATVLGTAFNGAAGALDFYNNAVDRTAIAFRLLTESASGFMEVQRQIQTLGFADGSISGGIQHIRDAYKEGQADLDALIERTSPEGRLRRNIEAQVAAARAPLDHRFTAEGRAEAEEAKRRAKELERLLNRGLSGGGRKSAGKERAGRERLDFSKNAAEELDRLIEKEGRATASFEHLAAELQGPLAVALLDHNERVKELNELAKESPVAAAGLSDALAKESKRYADVRKEIEAAQNPLGLLLDDMKFELDMIGKTNAERVVTNELRRQGIDLMSKEAQSALATARAYDAESQAKGRSIELQDEFRRGVADAITDFVTGTKSATDALKDFFDEFADQVTRAIANQWSAKLFGQPGQQGGGAVGDWIGKVMGLLSGGWKDGGAFNGGNVMAFANGGVFDRPTFFGMSSGRMGVMGEAGPEAIMPLERGRDGRLGVRMHGDSGARYGDFHMTQNVVVQGRPDNSTLRQIERASGRAAAKELSRTGR
ncbi:phage tail tape measure protein [Lysobacter tyrosinilyticus]